MRAHFSSGHNRKNRRDLLHWRALRETDLEVVKAICRLIDELAPNPAIAERQSLIEFVGDRPGHDLRYAIDPAKIKNDLGWGAS